MIQISNKGLSFGTLHTLPEPPPSDDGGKKRGAGSDGPDGKSLPAASNGMSNINSKMCI